MNTRAKQENRGRRDHSTASIAEGLRDDWERAKGNLRRAAGDLTDDDLRTPARQEAAVVDRVHRKTGRARGQIRRDLQMGSPAP